MKTFIKVSKVSFKPLMPKLSICLRTTSITGSISITGTAGITGSISITGTAGITGSIGIMGTTDITGNTSITDISAIIILVSIYRH